MKQVTIELTRYDRPPLLASHTSMRLADTDGMLAFEPVPTGTRMRWSWQVRPKGSAAMTSENGDQAGIRATVRRSRTRHLHARLAADADVLALPAGPPVEEPVAAADLAGLPTAAARYLRFAGVVGRPPDWSFQAHFDGRFRLRQGLPWLPCEAWQYNSRLDLARVFHMRIDAMGVVPMVGRDAYLHGRGQMRGRLLNLMTVAESSGPESDLSELVTFLNDAVFLAPSMLLRLPVSWGDADDHCFDVTLTDAGLRVTARVSVDERGAACDFSTGDRYCDTPDGPVRARWTTPVLGW